MRFFAIADLHLSFGTPNKEMDLFGEHWIGAPEKIAFHWREEITEEDMVLIPGDISWAMRLEEAAPDLTWIASLPGSKVMIRGNHDYWWPSISKLRKALPPKMYALQNDALILDTVAICGTRLWELDDSPIFARELLRLEASLQKAQGKKIVCMTHYPPTTGAMIDTPVTELLQKYAVSCAIFGHLHAPFTETFGVKNGIPYQLVSADFLDFKPLLLSL